MKIGERIKELRVSLNMTQDELAKLTGYKSRSSIQKIESGKRDITQSTIVAFAKALQVSPSVIMGWKKTLRIIIFQTTQTSKALCPLHQCEKYRFSGQ